MNVTAVFLTGLFGGMALGLCASIGVLWWMGARACRRQGCSPESERQS